MADHSKYIFNGQLYKKGKLVHAVIEDYVRKNPKKIYSNLKKDFLDGIQGKHGVFTTQKNALDIFEKEKRKYKRYYFKPTELIYLKDEVIATCNQWNFHNILIFIENANRLGLEIDFDAETLGEKQADKIIWISTIEKHMLVGLLYFENNNPKMIIDIFEHIHFPNHRKIQIKRQIEKNKEMLPRLYKLLFE